MSMSNVVGLRSHWCCFSLWWNPINLTEGKFLRKKKVFCGVLWLYG